MSTDNPAIIVKNLGTVEYLPTLKAMQQFTDQRGPEDADEFWVLQHPPVFTQGQAGKSEHVLDAGNIPVIQTDRGGQVTYHGPGQLIIYLLIDLKRRHLGVRDLVSKIESSIVVLLADYNVAAMPRSDAPGVYVKKSTGEPGAKIAQLGLRVRKGCSFHGLSLNVAMDVKPFSQINPCGHENLDVTTLQLQGGVTPDIDVIAEKLTDILQCQLGRVID